MKVHLHEEGHWGLVLEVFAEDADDRARLSLFVQQPGKLLFQSQSWNDLGPGCSWVSIAVLRRGDKPKWYERLRRALADAKVLSQ